MLRELQVTMNKPANAMYKAAVALKTGMAVVKDEAAKTFKLATAATADGLFFIDKERVPKGINASRTDMSDYESDFVDVEKDEFAKLIAYYPGERFATDQFVATGLAVGNSLEAGTDGKLKKSASTTKYIYKGTMDDNGHTLAIVEIAN